MVPPCPIFDQRKFMLQQPWPTLVLESNMFNSYIAWSTLTNMNFKTHYWIISEKLEGA